LKFLESPFTVYVGNVPSLARAHFEGLKAAYPKLRGVLIIDKTDAVLQEGSLVEMMWRRREIENYLLVPAAILRFCSQAAKDTFGSSAESGDTHLLFGQTLEVQTLFKKVSRISDEEFDAPLKDSPFLLDTKASEVILEPFFKEFYRMIGKYNVMPKNAFYRIAAVMEKEEIHPDVIEKLDAIERLS
jgi:hypothetical protein